MTTLNYIALSTVLMIAVMFLVMLAAPLPTNASVGL